MPAGLNIGCQINNFLEQYARIYQHVLDCRGGFGDPSFAPGARLALVPEPANEHDPNAVGIWNEARTLQAGYVPRDVAPDLAGDELTGNDVVAILSRVTGRPFTYVRVPLDVIRERMGEDAAKMDEWFDRVGYTVDREALGREFPDVAFHDFESWAKAQDWKEIQP